MIPFSPPRIDEKIIAEVVDTLRSGWITTGPKTRLFEKKLAEFCGVSSVLCLSSATAGLHLVLKWFGVKEGDEVILPAYTFSATANVVIHAGAKPVFVDVNEDDLTINVREIEKAITTSTKVIIPVDFAGLPIDYNSLNALVDRDDVKNLFQPASESQKKLGRILVLSDSAHSLGAVYYGKKSGSLTDLSVFSFHAVKNLTTGEGGAIAFNLPSPFDNRNLYNFFSVYSLHGQDKDAMSRNNTLGGWKYDVLTAGFKANMTDILASIGLVEIDRYESDTLVKFKHIFDKYYNSFKRYKWAELPVYDTANRISSFHLFVLRIKDITEAQRDLIIKRIFEFGVSVNVHFRQVPSLSFYRELGYKEDDYPVSMDSYRREITLPAFYDLSDKDINTIIAAVSQSVDDVLAL
jgi:dTDP-4-amino-4,6-dideoxygalactose transaminase